jgi:DNA-binding NarL/FixJ family response regulator
VPRQRQPVTIVNGGSEGGVTLVLDDPHLIVLEGMGHLFQAECNFRVSACCTDDVQTLEAMASERPSILIVDSQLPREGALGLLRVLKKRGLDTRSVLLANRLAEREIVEALRLGVHGVVLKDMHPRLLLQCVHRVSLGQRWIENVSFAVAMDQALRHESRAQELRRVLTPRELQVLTLVANGLPNRDIRAQLGITEGTVKIHLHNIYGKLGMKDRLQLALYARAEGPI